MSETIGFDEIEEVVKEAHERLKDSDPQAELESFGIDYESLAPNVIQQFGVNASFWLAGFHAALCVAQKHWEYRTPKSE